MQQFTHDGVNNFSPIDGKPTHIVSLMDIIEVALGVEQSEWYETISDWEYEYAEELDLLERCRKFLSDATVKVTIVSGERYQDDWKMESVYVEDFGLPCLPVRHGPDIGLFGRTGELKL